MKEYLYLHLELDKKHLLYPTLTSIPDSKNTDAGIEKVSFGAIHADAIQRMGSKMSRILPPRDADKKTATWARPVAV